jgi:hypothetical protein
MRAEQRDEAEKTVTELGGKLLGDLVVDRVTLLVAGVRDFLQTVSFGSE